MSQPSLVSMDSSNDSMPVSESHRFNEAALVEFLGPTLPEVKHGFRVEQFKGGQSNPTFKLITSEREFVMRAKPGPVAKLLPSAHAVEREFRVLKALHGTEVPVAKPYVLCEDEAVIGRAFYVMECVKGRILWEQGLPGMQAAERAAIYAEMNRVISTLHNLDYKALGLGDYGKPGNYFARQIGRWSKQYQASETEKLDAMDKLIEWLPSHIPAGDATSIVHGDFRLDNLIFHPTEPRVLAVLDWELSTLGHPLADFSYHCMSWHIDPGDFRGIKGLDFAALGIPTEREYRETYAKATATNPANLDHAIPDATSNKDWAFYLAYNMFRLAAILQGIMKRVVDGTASSAEASATGKRAKVLANSAWALAQQVK